jgi:hypothetical protein
MRLIIPALLFAAFVFDSSGAMARVQFPSEQDLNTFSKTCGGGRVEVFERKVTREFRGLRSNPKANISLESAQRNVAAVMEKVTPDANGNEMYEKYLRCVREFVDKFLVSNNVPHQPVNPGSDVDGFISIGATYGSIRQGFTNDNQLIWLARVGWWFNEHLAFGLEGTFWQVKSQTLSLNGQLVQAGQPLRQTGSTATLPLYVHFGRRFPLVLCAGAGLGWESYDYLLLDGNGVVEGKLTNRDSGLAVMVGAGFEFAWTPHTTLSVLARGTRTNIDVPSTTATDSIGRKAKQTVLSLGVALSFH